MPMKELAVVDLETTGFSPTKDRIVEIGVFRTTADGRTLSEWSTLVNPDRDMGATRVHGIRASDVRDAPTFREIAGDLAAQLAGAFMVAHNARFDASFVAAEFRRLPSRPPALKPLCTLSLAKLLCSDLERRSLEHCCEHFGIRRSGAHRASDDAKATAAVLHACLTIARQRGTNPFEEFDCEPLPALDRWPKLETSGRVRLRGIVCDQPSIGSGFLARLVQRLPREPRGHSTGRHVEYLELLDRMLEDGILTEREEHALMELAADWGLGQTAVEDLHRRYLASLVATAMADGLVSDAERAELDNVAGVLGLSNELGQTLATQAPATSPLENGLRRATLTGLSVCFTGELLSTLAGNEITRSQAEALARNAGLDVVNSVTKKLDVLVVADPHTQSGKAKKARSFGTRIMTEKAFWRSIGVGVD
jgi:DNA polymerase-3 subunit epsilon